MSLDLSEYIALFASDSMQHLLRVVKRTAPSDASVLVTGEAGVGKELIADMIHLLSGRPASSLLKITWCSSLGPAELKEAYAAAGGGTLLLRDVCEMSTHAQGALLGFIETQARAPAPDHNRAKPAPRLISLTNHSPEQALEQGSLRTDLFYRVSTIHLHIPPLRERREDIIPLANRFLKRCLPQVGREIAGFTQAAATLLRSHNWRGNGSELQNQVLRAALSAQGSMIDVSDLSVAALVAPADQQSHDTSFTVLQDVERNSIIQVLKETGGNKLEAAKRLGIGRQTLYNKIKAYGIEL